MIAAGNPLWSPAKFSCEEVLPMRDRNREMAERIAEAVARQGGRVYYVGGLVRDRLLGRENKDVDIEVHGIRPEALEAILDRLGQRTEMGASFGVYGLRHYELDIAMPRKEQATGRGHRDFAVFVDPFLGTQKAAQRRDFTMNALMEDVLTGEIIDHFGGQADLMQGVVRHVNDISFAEDPLRVLRAAQFAARFGFAVAEETVALCGRMDLTALASERIYGELEKALLKSPHPSTFFELLRQMGQLRHWFPEVEALIGARQERGKDAWSHSMRVLDRAAQLRSEAREPAAFMLSALCCDFPTPEVAEALLSRLTTERLLHKYVTNMVELRSQPVELAAQHAEAERFCQLYDRSACPEDLLLLVRAAAPDGDWAPVETELQDMLAHYKRIMALPFVQGADLVAAGFEPGRDFHQALAYAHEMRLAGVSKAEALRRTSNYLMKLRGNGGNAQ